MINGPLYCTPVYMYRERIITLPWQKGPAPVHPAQVSCEAAAPRSTRFPTLTHNSKSMRAYAPIKLRESTEISALTHNAKMLLLYAPRKYGGGAAPAIAQQLRQEPRADWRTPRCYVV
jgi:hypothetical protein